MNSQCDRYDGVTGCYGRIAKNNQELRHTNIGCSSRDSINTDFSQGISNKITSSAFICIRHAVIHVTQIVIHYSYQIKSLLKVRFILNA